MTVPRSEHPRPDWVRTDRHWSCLNGPWKFAFDDLDEGLDQVWQQDERRFNQTITVPFAFQTEASGINDKDIHEVGESQYSCTLVRMQAHNCDDPFAFSSSPVWYSRRVQVPAEVDAATRALLHFGAVDYEATVFVSGSQVNYLLLESSSCAQ